MVHYSWVAAHSFHKRCHRIVTWHCSLQQKEPKLGWYFTLWKWPTFFCLETCRIFFPPCSFKFLWNYVIVLLLLLILPGTLEVLSVIFFKCKVFSLSIDFDPFVFFFSPLETPSIWNVDSKFNNFSWIIFLLFSFLFSLKYCNYGSEVRGVNRFFNIRKPHRMTIVKEGDLVLRWYLFGWIRNDMGS